VRRLATIVSLLFFRAPFHVAFFVVTFIADSVNGMRWRRLRSKLCVELFERFKAELNSASAIVRISVMVRIGASLLCASVRHVFRGCLAVAGMSVCYWPHMKTTAALSVPGSETVNPNDGDFSASTFTLPERSMLAFGVERKSFERPKHSTGNIDESWAMLYRRIIFSHVVPTSIGYCLVRAGRERQFLLGSFGL